MANRLQWRGHKDLYRLVETHSDVLTPLELAVGYLYYWHGFSQRTIGHALAKPRRTIGYVVTRLTSKVGIKVANNPKGEERK